MKLQRERKFLVEVPLKWYGKFKILTSDRKRIIATFLKSDAIISSFLTCATTYDKINISKVQYDLYESKYISTGIFEEESFHLGPSQYKNLLQKEDKKRNKLSKVRYFINFQEQVMNLDVFDDNLIGLAILGIPMDDVKKEVILPPYIKISKEITNNMHYLPINLASLGSYSRIG